MQYNSTGKTKRLLKGYNVTGLMLKLRKMFAGIGIWKRQEGKHTSAADRLSTNQVTVQNKDRFHNMNERIAGIRKRNGTSPDFSKKVSDYFKNPVIVTQVSPGISRVHDNSEKAVRESKK